MTSLRERLERGETLVGTFCAIADPLAIEVTGTAGFDFLLIDAEHAMIARNQIEGLVRAGDVVGAPTMFRVPGLEGDWIASVLDSGGAGVMVPRIETADQARAAVAAMRYPPQGKRGIGPGRATGYGRAVAHYLASANDTLLLAIQIESAEGLANIDAIAAVEGIDVIYIGPGDLSVSLGALGPENRPKVDAAIAAIIASCRDAQRTAGTFHFTEDTLATAIADGLRFHTVGSDIGFLRQAAESAGQAIAQVKR